jgi:hypothetical protein
MLIGRFAGTVVKPASPLMATVVFANPGMNWLTGLLSVSAPSSINAMMATLVTAFDCDAMRKTASVVIFRPDSLSLQPTARS